MDEVSIKIDKEDEHWVEVRINIPSATICIMGNDENIDAFKNIF